MIPDVLVTSWPAFSLTGSFSSLTLLLFWLLMKIAAPGNFFPRNGQSGSCIVCDLHPFLQAMGFGLHARSGRLNCHSSITSDRPFPCTLQLAGCPQASRLEYHRLLLSTAVESGGAAGVSSVVDEQEQKHLLKGQWQQVCSALARSVFRLHQQSGALEICITFKALFVIFFHF